MFRRRPPRGYASRGGHDDRRAGHRTPAAKVLALLGRWDGAEFLTAPAAPLDISLGGARVFTRDPPPAGATFWLRLEGPPASDWVAATALEVVAGRGRGAMVRLRFREGCPYDFFLAATRIAHVAEAEAEAKGGTGSYWYDTYWR